MPHGSYWASNIQDYFEYISKKYRENVVKPSVQLYVKRTEDRITFKIKDGYSLELLTSETTNLLGSTKNKNNQR